MIGSTFWEKTWLAAHFGKKTDWQHILGKILLAAHSVEKTSLAAHFGKKYIIGSKLCGKTWLGTQSDKKNIIDSKLWWEKHDW